MWYLLIAIVVWLAGLGWIWWAARHAPEMYDGEQTHPPRDTDNRRSDAAER